MNISRYLRKWITPYILVVLLTIPAILPLLRTDFFPTQDYIYVTRLYQFDKSLSSGEFPVRWSQALRYGEPTFNFYAPLPYYFGSFIKSTFSLIQINFSYIEVSKILLISGFIFSALTIYLLAKELFGKWGGILAAVMYTYAPYHSVDVYVRGALSESLALVFFPLIFLFILKIAKNSTTKNLLFLSLSFAGLFLTHNVMTMIFLPFILLWGIYWLLVEKKKRSILFLSLSIVLAFGLSASFLLPAFFEKDFIQSQFLTSGYFDFRAHFITLGQLFSNFWGYGPSVWGQEDGISFQIGIVHFLILALTALLLALVFIKKKIKPKNYLYPYGLFVLVLLMLGFSLLMMHNKSTPIWLLIPTMPFVQFPWRFLGISIFLISLLGGVLGLYLNKRTAFLAIILVVVLIVFNINYFKPQRFEPEEYFDFLTDDEELFVGNSIPKDYLPIWVKEISDDKLRQPQITHGSAVVSEFKKNGSKATIKIESKGNSDIEVPVTYFPGWQLLIDNKPASLKDPSDLGLIQFSVPDGNHQILLKLTDTPIRTLGNWITAISILTVYFLLFKKRFPLIK